MSNNLTAMVRKDKRNGHILTSMFLSQTEGNYYKYKKSPKMATGWDYKRLM